MMYILSLVISKGSMSVAISNAETVVRILKLLEAHKIEDQIELSTISLIESKTIQRMDQEA